MRGSAELQKVCDRWNRKHPIGSRVIYHPIIGERKGTEMVTRSEAYILSGHTACIFLEGKAGCVALDAVQPLD